MAEPPRLQFSKTLAWWFPPVIFVVNYGSHLQSRPAHCHTKWCQSRHLIPVIATSNNNQRIPTSSSRAADCLSRFANTVVEPKKSRSERFDSKRPFATDFVARLSRPDGVNALSLFKSYRRWHATYIWSKETDRERRPRDFLQHQRPDGVYCSRFIYICIYA